MPGGMRHLSYGQGVNSNQDLCYRCSFIVPGEKSMKKTFIIIINVIIMAAILVFVVLYSRIESRNSYSRQVEHFEKTTVTMERVTENYLEGEQRICDVWAKYINKLADDREMLKKLQDNLYEFVKDRYSLDTICKKRVEFYKKLVGVE